MHNTLSHRVRLRYPAVVRDVRELCHVDLAYRYSLFMSHLLYAHLLFVDLGHAHVQAAA